MLAEMLNSSTSSSSSDDSTSNSSGSSIGSRTTVQRLRRALRHGRRRKSSSSSKEGNSVATVISHDLNETLSQDRATEAVADNPEPQNYRSPNLGIILSGDEADTDGEVAAGSSTPRVKDFASSKKRFSPPSKRRRTPQKGDRKGKRSLTDGIIDAEELSYGPVLALTLGEGQNLPSDSQSNRKVEFTTTSNAEETIANNRRTFNFRQLSAKPAFRPVLPKVLSQNVFTTGPAQGVILDPTAFKIGPLALRRTTSLPDRLNQSQPVNAPSSSTVPQRQSSGTAVPDEKNKGDGPTEAEKPQMSRSSAILLLLATTVLVAVCAEFLLNAIPGMLKNSSVSEAFIGVIILPVVGNAAEHVTAVKVAAKNKMDLAIGVAVGSSIQIGE